MTSTTDAHLNSILKANLRMLDLLVTIADAVRRPVLPPDPAVERGPHELSTIGQTGDGVWTWWCNCGTSTGDHASEEGARLNQAIHRRRHEHTTAAAPAWSYS